MDTEKIHEESNHDSHCPSRYLISGAPVYETGLLYKSVIGNPEMNRQLARPISRWMNNVLNWILKEWNLRM
jgi:hypothetical protein